MVFVSLNMWYAYLIFKVSWTDISQNIEFPDCSLFLIFSPLHIKYDNGCGSNENGSNNNKLKDNGSNGNGSNYNGSNDEYIYGSLIFTGQVQESRARGESIWSL